MRLFIWVSRSSAAETATAVQRRAKTGRYISWTRPKRFGRCGKWLVSPSSIIARVVSAGFRAGTRDVTDEGEFWNWRRETLHSEAVKRVVENLYAQAST